jgi:hypothetical protein
MVRLAGGPAEMRGAVLTDRATLLDAAVAAMSGRIRVHEDQDSRAEEVIAELLDAALAGEDDDRAARPPDQPPPTPSPATDPRLRADARRLARQLLPPLGRVGPPRRRGTRRMVSRAGALTGDLDLDRTIDRADGLRPRDPGRLVVREFAAAPRAVCLLVDRSGSMSRHAVALAAVAAAAVVRAASDRLRCGVIAFAGDTMVLRDLRDDCSSERVIDDLLSLRGHGRTDLAAALRAAGGTGCRPPRSPPWATTSPPSCSEPEGLR